jgi:hypothetical protein
MKRKKLYILSKIMQEFYFEEFISFAALFFIHKHMKFPASAFHDFNKEQIGKKKTFAK